MNALPLLLGAALSIWWVDPYGTTPYLPDAEPAGGIPTNTISLAAARGEIETVSFSVRPARDLRLVDFIPSDLTGPGGATIPASASDFALVKVWYRADNRWITSWSGNTGKPTLINDLILHDNDLIRVVEAEDPAKRTILLRFSYPEGPVYVDMRKHGGGRDHFRHEVYPVMDAKKFVPFDLKEGRFQQYWFTWKIPDDARAGLYRGTLEVREDGKPLGKLPVEVEVYPFALPSARTHYDTSRPFISAWMGTPSLAGELAHSKNLAVSEAKCRNIYRSLAEHNAHEPSGPGVFGANDTDDLAVRSLILMRQAGMRCNVIINGHSMDFGWAAPVEKPFISPEEDPELYERTLGEYRNMADVQAAVLDKYLGHRNCYFCGPDECGTYQHRRGYGFFAELHKRGFKTWSDYGVPEDISWSIGMNDVPAAARHTTAWLWHKGSALAVTYAGTFTGPSCPDIWRRTKGLRYYYADFDGLHEYVLFYNRWNHWNDFKWRGSYTQMQIVYPTYDGIIATLAWEGVREALDDIRYLSLLRLRAEAAMRSADPAIRACGREHFVWMDAQDPEAIIDLHAFRREVARRITILVGLVGEEPPEAPLKPVPGLPPCTFGKEIPADYKGKLNFARECVRRHRYDIALPLLASIREDPATTLDQTIEVTLAEVPLLCEMLRRDEAVRLLDGLLERRELTRAQRGRFLLRKVQTLLTDRIFEEEYTAAQLDAAAAVLAEAAGFQLPQQEHFEAVNRMANAYVAGGSDKPGIDFIDAQLADARFDAAQRSTLLVKRAQAYTALKDWDQAATSYRLANNEQPFKNREILKAQGHVAEMRQDWKTARDCYLREETMYNKDEEGDLRKSCIARLNRVLEKLQGQPRAAVSIDDLDSAPVIQLEE